MRLAVGALSAVNETEVEVADREAIDFITKLKGLPYVREGKRDAGARLEREGLGGRVYL